MDIKNISQKIAFDFDGIVRYWYNGDALDSNYHEERSAESRNKILGFWENMEAGVCFTPIEKKGDRIIADNIESVRNLVAMKVATIKNLSTNKFERALDEVKVLKELSRRKTERQLAKGLVVLN